MFTDSKVRRDCSGDLLILSMDLSFFLPHWIEVILDI